MNTTKTMRKKRIEDILFDNDSVIAYIFPLRL
jgi:hypothetical protein